MAEIGALKNSDYEVWVPFKNGKVLIRHITARDIQEINKNASRKTWDRKHRPASEVDEEKANVLLGRKAVRGWVNFTDDGKEFPYSEENCDFLMRNWIEFIDFVVRVCSDLDELMELKKAETEKNFSPTSGQG